MTGDAQKQGESLSDNQPAAAPPKPTRKEPVKLKRNSGFAEEAVAEYREAVRLKPDYTAAHRGLGRALERAGRPDDAIAAYRRGLEVAEGTGDLQTKKEMEVFLRRLDRRS